MLTETKHIYERAINLAILENATSAIWHGDTNEIARQAETFCKIIAYVNQHGYVLDTKHDGSVGFRLIPSSTI
jgi:hypothetical protein